ncbi:invasion associated locus B family protein [uncultured Bartonella sp.]|uniref:invasion associated locus B family protein n=1 Tax=uncultured Bartonella sp. TaxID=104108 RepID=UPI0026119EC5|nr:invasion associated locus B family protein [uncultured Bartonella sp.]
MSLRQFFKRACGVVALSVSTIGLFLNVALAQAANQQDIPAPKTFGAWTKICSLPPGTPNIQCEVVQNVRAQDRPDITFRVTLYKLPKNQGTLMRVFVPIRVELRLGVGIKIDDKDMGKMEYRRCLGDNCVAEAFLKAEDLKSFLEGKMATYFIFTTPEEGIGGIIDLNGLKDAYDSLPKE